jgi:hypothetical protein
MEPASTTDDLIAQLTAATVNLCWSSETDAPFTVQLGPTNVEEPLNSEQVLAWAQLPLDTPINAVDLDEFLAPVLTPQSWHTSEESATVARFQALQTLLHKRLTHLRVYRCGEIELTLYIVGQTPQADWIVLQTSAVET